MQKQSEFAKWYDKAIFQDDTILLYVAECINKLFVK